MRFSSRRDYTRREFVERAALAAAVLAGTNGAGLQWAAAQASGTERLGWKIVMVSDKEPGEPLVVSGRILAADGQTPLEGIILYVYHTDAQGLYSKERRSGAQPRLRGRMQTNAEGRYEFRTIRPASYPGQRIPAHIHASVTGPEYPEHWIPEYWFEDDPHLSAQDRARFSGMGRFSAIQPMKRDSAGVLQYVRDIKMPPR